MSGTHQEKETGIRGNYIVFLYYPKRVNKIDANRPKEHERFSDNCAKFFFFFLMATPAAYGSSQAGVEQELQLPAYTTAHATLDP